MSRNRSFLISEVGKIVELLLISEALNAKINSTFSALKRVKTYLSSTMGNNWLHALILVHVYKNILDKINSADAGNEFVDRKGSCKQTFIHFSNICKIH